VERNGRKASQEKINSVYLHNEGIAYKPQLNVVPSFYPAGILITGCLIIFIKNQTYA